MWNIPNVAKIGLCVTEIFKSDKHDSWYIILKDSVNMSHTTKAMAHVCTTEQKQVSNCGTMLLAVLFSDTLNSIILVAQYLKAPRYSYTFANQVHLYMITLFLADDGCYWDVCSEYFQVREKEDSMLMCQGSLFSPPQ